jgi:hypothetical protein
MSTKNGPNRQQAPHAQTITTERNNVLRKASKQIKEAPQNTHQHRNQMNHACAAFVLTTDNSFRSVHAKKDQVK